MTDFLADREADATKTWEKKAQELKDRDESPEKGSPEVGLVEPRNPFVITQSPESRMQALQASVAMSPGGDFDSVIAGAESILDWVYEPPGKGLVVSPEALLE